MGIYCLHCDRHKLVNNFFVGKILKVALGGFSGFVKKSVYSCAKVYINLVDYFCSKFLKCSSVAVLFVLTFDGNDHDVLA